jgi:hypothetical protein
MASTLERMKSLRRQTGTRLLRGRQAQHAQAARAAPNPQTADERGAQELPKGSLGQACRSDGCGISRQNRRRLT